MFRACVQCKILIIVFLFYLFNWVRLESCTVFTRDSLTYVFIFLFYLFFDILRWIWNFSTPWPISHYTVSSVRILIGSKQMKVIVAFTLDDGRIFSVPSPLYSHVNDWKVRRRAVAVLLVAYVSRRAYSHYTVFSRLPPDVKSTKTLKIIYFPSEKGYWHGNFNLCCGMQTYLIG